MSALAFAESPPYPVNIDGALFVGDYVKQCIWVMQAGNEWPARSGDARDIGQRAFRRSISTQDPMGASTSSTSLSDGSPGLTTSLTTNRRSPGPPRIRPYGAAAAD